MTESHATQCPTVPTVSVPTVSSGQFLLHYHFPPYISQGKRSLAASPAGMELQESLLKLDKRFRHRRDDLANQTQRRDELAAKLRAAFQTSPLEDGFYHPSQLIIKEALYSLDGYPILDWLKAFSVDATRPDFAASVLCCLGRQQRPGTVAWRVEVVREALSMDAVEIRDAAAQAADSWGDPEMREILQKHTDPVPWLQEYVLNILKDIQS